MCGIVGYLNRTGAPIDFSVLEAMRVAQRHRGPDDAGAVTFSLRDGTCRNALGAEAPLEGGLAFNRLSIQDLSANGHQPMANVSGSLWIVFNGEIYNAADYRSELESRGFRFLGHSDTEVLLALYEAYGLEGLLQRVNGMFAFVIADLQKQRLVLCRDRLGIKPLYYYEDGDVFAFASEVKSFLHHPSFSAQLDRDALPEYLQFRYVAGEQTLLKGIRQLAPGTSLTLGTGGGLTTRRYWKPPLGEPIEARAYARIVEEVEARLEASVRSQLLSDVPVGCQLSGGIDSSLVTVLANDAQSSHFEAFSVVVDDPVHSEEQWIDEVSRSTGVRVHKFPMTEDTFADRLQAATWHLDQPVNHPNTLGIKYLAECSRPSVTVMLSGEGADEVFGGYHRFFRGQFFPAVHLAQLLLSPVPYFHRRLANFRGDQASWFIKLSAYVGDGHARAVCHLADPAAALERRRQTFEPGPGFLRSALNYEMGTYLPDLLIRQDKMTMAHSIENRVPFLDHTLVEYAARLPGTALVGLTPHVRDTEMRNLKRVLKSVALRHFSDTFVFRPKAGFSVPLSRFLRTPAIRSLVHEQFLPSAKRRGIFNVEVLEMWYRNLTSPGNVEAFWVCFAFELWANLFLDARRATA